MQLYKPLSPNAAKLTRRQFYEDLKSIFADSRNNSLSATNNKRLLFGLVNTNLTHYNGPFLDTLSLFLAKSIIASKNRPKHLIKKRQLLYSLYIVNLTSECRRIVLKNVLLKIETSPRVRKYFLNGLVLFFTGNVFRYV